MKISSRLLVLAAAGAISPFMLHAAPDAPAAGATLANPGTAPRDVTLPDGTFVRLGAHSSGAVNAAGELVLEKGSAVIIAKDGAPVTLVTGDTRTTVTGGTVIVSATKDAGLRVIALAGETTVAVAGGESVDLEPGHTTTVFPAKAGEPATTGPVVAVDLAAIAKSSRLLNAAPLPSAGAFADALADQRESLTAGDLSPTGQLLVAASRERGLGFASADDVQNALSLRGTALKTENAGVTRNLVAQAVAALAANPNNPAGNTLATGTILINGVATPVLVDTATGQVAIGAGGGIQTSGGTLIIGGGSGTVITNGAISGGSLTVTNSGTLTLTGANTYTGGPQALGEGQLTSGNYTLGTVGNASGASLVRWAPINVGDLNVTAVSGTGTLTKTGSGTLTLSGTYNGATNLAAGTLSTATGSFANTGATFNITGDGALTSSTPTLTFADKTVTISNGKTLTLTAPETVTVKNTNFVAATGATTGSVVINATGTGLTDADKRTSDTLVALDTVTFAPVQSLQANSRTIALKNVTFDQGRLLSRDGVLNIGSVVDGAVNFVSGVKTSDNTDLTTAAGINAKVNVVPGTILQNGAPMAGATGAGAGATIVIDRR